ncbi:DMSO/TMAO reductase YedYZ, molybdopterin-dependent catalytic subunit [Streptomyces wuyuanensis]|uniref:DMSO/TMAO reductase YedYZ, molybdopterin-dependent catalytic subunit n=1 Tax=Streptomyces wuyuanensis TaxID=1196353 RepID=A0A1G9ZQZ4_9ACTN|nr:DMSO/TMAO reductase YedYZ, molybdopterin-dependent catalytic subunit [Streptomyces wuyuanensis]
MPIPSSRTPARRSVLKLLASAPVAAAVPLATGGPAAAAGPGIVKPLPPGLFTVRGTNAETDFAAFRDTGLLTPADRFFVRNHTSTPVLSETDWKLTLWGSGLIGSRAVEFRYGDLRSMPSVTRTAFIECAGNGRSFYASQQGETVTGTSWTLGAVGTARWRGVRLAEVLRRAGVASDTVDVMPRGLDDPHVSGGVSLGRVRRPIPLAKALDDVILAYEMNGEPLPYDHGFPVRVVVPAWVGIASVKWVGDIEVSTTPLHSPWNTGTYRLFGDAYPPGGSAPLTRQTVKSAFELPFQGRLAAGRTRLLTGRSWSGAAPVSRVEISTDGGERWRPAVLRDAPRRDGWVRWAAPWQPRRTGDTVLMARATDAAGNTQPARSVHNTQGYLFDAAVRHPVTVL